MKKRLILASASPRRRELLEQAGIAFEVMVSEADETTELTDPDELVRELSRRKAEAVAKMLSRRKAKTVAKKESRSKAKAVAKMESVRMEENRAPDVPEDVSQDSVLSDQRASDAGVLSESSCIIVLGADTVVALDGMILGKPADPDDAVQMLMQMQGKRHTVHTGVTLLNILEVSTDIAEENSGASIYTDDIAIEVVTGEADTASEMATGTATDGADAASETSIDTLGMTSEVGSDVIGHVREIETFSVRTDVWIAPMTEEEIRAYVATGEPLDAAGSYKIQGRFARHIERIDGDYTNVVGLPVHAVYRALRRWDA